MRVAAIDTLKFAKRLQASGMAQARLPLRAPGCDLGSQAVEEPTSPRKLTRQDDEPQRDNHHPRPGQEEQDEAHEEEKRSADDYEGSSKRFRDGLHIRGQCIRRTR